MHTDMQKAPAHHQHTHTHTLIRQLEDKWRLGVSLHVLHARSRRHGGGRAVQ